MIAAHRLRNGMLVVTREVHSSPIATCWILYRVGSRNERAETAGISHWLEHILFNGTVTRPKRAMSHLVARHGGMINGFTSNDYTAYYSKLPVEHIELALGIESDRMMNTLFEPDEIERERRVVIAEREARENDASWWLNEAVTAQAFQQHPYRHPVIGWKHTLQDMPSDAPYEHYKHHYMPNNAVLVLVGGFKTDTIMRRVERFFGDLPAGTKPVSPAAAEPIQQAPRRVVVSRPGTVQYVHLAYHTPDCGHPDFAALTVLDAILSGAKPTSFSGGNAFSRSTRLYQALVESRMTAAVSSQYTPTRDPYLFKFKATVQSGCTAAEIETLLHQEICRVQQDGVRDAEVSMALKQIQAQFAYAQERITSQAWMLGVWEMLGGYTRADTVRSELAAVTAADVRRVAQAYLVEENSTIGHFIPGEHEAAVGDTP